jgi:hypothetical protein
LVVKVVATTVQQVGPVKQIELLLNLLSLPKWLLQHEGRRTHE